MEMNMAKFSEKLAELIELAKKKKNVLEYQEINDFFKDFPLDAEHMDKVFDYLDPSRENYQRLLLNSLSMLPVCDEIRIRETMYLCKELNRSEEAIKILEDIILEANESDDERLIEQVIKVLFRIMQESDGIEWYCALSRKYPDIIEMILELGLRYNTGPEYERRYPAKLLTDIYWQQIYDNAGENVM